MKAPTANVCVNLPDGDPWAPFTELAVVPKDLVQLFPAVRAGTGDRAGLHGSGGTPRGNANVPPIKTKAVGLRRIGLCGRTHGPGHGERQRRNLFTSSAPALVFRESFRNNPWKSPARHCTAAGFQALGAKRMWMCCVLWAGAESAGKPGESA